MKVYVVMHADYDNIFPVAVALTQARADALAAEANAAAKHNKPIYDRHCQHVTATNPWYPGRPDVPLPAELVTPAWMTSFPSDNCFIVQETEWVEE